MPKRYQLSSATRKMRGKPTAPRQVSLEKTLPQAHDVLVRQSQRMLRRMFPSASTSQLEVGAKVLSVSLLDVMMNGNDDYEAVISDAEDLRLIFQSALPRPPMPVKTLPSQQPGTTRA
jgi:hypothetical protein